MELKVGNFFHYYMFNLNAPELSKGDKIKATLAAVALGVFSLGIVPLICRLTMYDKNIGLINKDDQSKVSKTAEKVNSKTAEKVKAKKTYDLSKPDSIDLKKLSLDEVSELGKLATDEQLGELIFSNLNLFENDLERFKAIFDPKESRIQEMIKGRVVAQDTELMNLFSKEHWKMISDKGALNVSQSVKRLKNPQLFVDAVFNEDEARFNRLIQTVDLYQLKPYLNDNLRKKADVLHNETLKKLATMEPEELSKIASKLSDEEIVAFDYSEASKKTPEEQKKIVKALINPYNRERPQRILALFPKEQVQLMCNGFEYFHWIKFYPEQLKGLDLTKIQEPENRKAAVEAMYQHKKENRIEFFKELQAKPEQFKIVEESLTPRLFELLKEELKETEKEV